MRFLFLLWSAVAAAGADRATVTVLATTDLHGNIYAIDYFSGKPAARGLAKIATLIRDVRRENPNTILIDCGDTIQGAPLEYVYQTLVRTGRGPLGIEPPQPLLGDPMMLVMSRLGYAAMAVGNHEYNFGLENLNQARSDARFPWLSANTTVAPGSRERPFEAYIVREVGPVKVAIVGATTPAVPTWEKPENLGGYRFGSAREAVRTAIDKLRASERPDLVILAAHGGLGAPGDSTENFVREVAAAVPELDGVVFGHTHRELEGTKIGNALVTQPKNWGESLARLDFTMEQTDGRWKRIDTRSRLIPVTPSTPAAADILELARPYHEFAERYLSLPVATAAARLRSALGAVEDTALIDAIHQVQLYYSKADVSFTALFNAKVEVPSGPVTVRQIAALYPYENELYVIAGNGGMVKAALENAARYFLSCERERCESSLLINSQVIPYNYDMAEGVGYEIDLTRPVGERIRNLRWKGAPLRPDQPLKLAINHYRAAGSAGYSMYVGAPVIWRSREEIRDMMIRYYAEVKQFPERASGNWRIVPEGARRKLVRDALEAEQAP
jgi:2',3'-cyclic-nucleotide 2'-phosphodiesterase/3'-nucleotidase